MKKIDKLILGAFIGPFLITFLVVVFILLNINMLKYFDDIIGKGIDSWTLGQLFFYFAIFTVPTALPLAVLLSSLISFGNLGEHFELTAIKAAGISLIRALQPIFLFVVMLTGVAFYANNYLVPKAALEAYSLLYDIKHKKPALDLREGSFYGGLDDISIKVDKKYPDGITLKNVIIYDHRKNDGNKEVTVADSGRMFSILNDYYLKLELFNGYNYTEGASNERALAGQKGRNSESLSRSQFSKMQVVFDLSSFALQRTDKQWFQGNRQMRNMSELEEDIDSMRRQIMAQRLTQYHTKATFFNYYLKKDSLILPEDVHAYKVYHDSVEQVKYAQVAASHVISTTKETKITADTANAVRDSTTIAGKDSLKGGALDTAKQVIKKDNLVNRTAIPKKPGVSRGLFKNSDSLRLLSKKTPVKSASRKAKALKAYDGQASKYRTVPKTDLKPPPPKKIKSDSAIKAELDTIFRMSADEMAYQSAGSAARQVKSQLSNTNIAIENYQKEQRVFEIQWHKIIASSFACIAMFLIGAPLGAIIKKGGLGMPFLVSIFFFIIYYVVTMQGEKLAKQGTLGIILGVWLADIILFVVGLFFLRQARADARLFESDFYNVVFNKIKFLFGSKLRRKPRVV